MKSLALVDLETVKNFESSTHDLHLLKIEDILDPEKVAELRDLNRRYETLSNKEIKRMNAIQAILLNQFYIYERKEDQFRVGVLVQREPRADKKPAVAE